MYASLNLILLSQVKANDRRTVTVNGAECHRMPREDECLISRQRSGVHILLLILDTLVSPHHDSASFITFIVRVCACECLCVCGPFNRNEFSLNWHCKLLANSWSARKICNYEARQ